ncbi:DUF116 domain-containing protein [Alkaliphilus transvaalensis]|uniref:DUF116 domain-containing protein n=1 Tax=Alkaliphilus transvaalensis TaxID=114628 RepID=UPI000556A2AC|nr:DUF116 domain-containing protein [Alkaliphilus transvaalensis]
MLVTLLGIVALLIGGLIIISLQNHLDVFRVVILALLFFLLLIGLLIATTILSIMLLWYNNSIPKPLMKIVEFTIPLLYPIMVVVGKGLKIEKNTIRRAYTLINNKLVMATSYNLKGEAILVLTPHCLQKSFCPHKITHKVENCKRCGLCSVDQLIGLKEKYGINFIVVTGGTLARKMIMELRPKAIVAIACERDLVGGLMDVKKVPIIAVINQRPEGPCINTNVDIKEVERAVCHFIKE